ncbi:Malate/lactate/ureidoglycolate dehydrogenase, LDH2 family [Thermanaeromonas toyohensis ToBE]|uniref:Malate/lactate/ureidoglycolate dehydrogenase, LDH2 family n=1 Tax=Thermanaeromonas toyohensis ToBE TaxID=698762 RepID=A0A1W1W1T8_9FIRM|nr:Ldh family oxidoreductase [Thermanaeromonas toyohensis]SMB99567.1 Malate/lactate/ureidoglycolate dehydrogenase, LDH2 family [Thermanaeromonas toyohensis ToBE]
MKSVEASRLEKFAVEALIRVGATESDAKTVATFLVRASLRGIDSHGIMRLPTYVKRAKQGLINTHARIRVVSEVGSLALVDGDNGFGQVVGKEAMDWCIKRAKETGIAAAAIRNSNNFGAASLLAMQASEKGMIGFVFTNTAPAMPPWGGTTLTLGTNPIACAVPSDLGFPIVMDMSTTVVARDKIRAMAKQGKKIPPGWALDKLGRPTEDPLEALDGILLPVGSHKGYCLAFMVEVLSGVLSGSLFGRDVRQIYDFTGPQGVGHFVGCINIEGIMPLNEFKHRLAQLIAQVKSSDLAEGCERIYLPGEIEFNIEQERLRTGIPVPEEVIRELANLGEYEGLEPLLTI